MELIDKLLNNDLYKVAIIDDDICMEEVKNKLIKVGFNDIVSNAIAKEIRNIEICEELLQRQALKLETKPSNLPLIVDNGEVLKESLQPYLTQVMTIDEIMIEILKYGNALPSNLNREKILVVFINKSKTMEQSSLVHYFSLDDLDKVEIECENVLDNTITKSIYSFGPITTNYTSIITTYQEIMKPSYKFNLQVIDENTVLVESKKQGFKVLMIDNINDLDETDLNKYHLIIPKQSTELSSSVLKEPNVNDIYRYCYTQPGRHFNRGK